MSHLLQQLDQRGVLTLTLNRPEVHNAFDSGLIETLTDSLIEAARNPDIRLVAITGAGDCFSAGADLNWMRSMVSASQRENEQDALALARLMRTLNYLDQPTIAVVNGHAFGGGLGLVACCDISICVETARFGLTETTLGLAPAVISPYVFRCIGEANARRYFITGERFGAKKARRLGLVQQVAKQEKFTERTRKLIDALLMAAPGAILASKKLVFAVAGHDENQQLKLDEYTAKLIAKLRVSAEGQEGLSAFLEKRKPDWVKPGDG
jgi:methylglutaconyl-CoA hydratase